MSSALIQQQLATNCNKLQQVVTKRNKSQKTLVNNSKIRT